MAVVLEALCGWLGFLGVGYLLRGYIATGLGLMVLWWLVLAVMLGTAIVVTPLGVGLVCVGPVWFAVPLLSAMALSNRQ
ncbi:MAG TPA: hypothetical protein VFB73_15975 [Chloroflexota bacterium]|nr:hypothetical protein [Chloroflexota bacterium]